MCTCSIGARTHALHCTNTRESTPPGCAMELTRACVSMYFLGTPGTPALLDVGPIACAATHTHAHRYWLCARQTRESARVHGLAESHTLRHTHTRACIRLNYYTIGLMSIQSRAPSVRIRRKLSVLVYYACARMCLLVRFLWRPLGLTIRQSDARWLAATTHCVYVCLCVLMSNACSPLNWHASVQAGREILQSVVH